MKAKISQHFRSRPGCNRLHESERTWYHGRTYAAQNFDLSKIGNGFDQEGPGFYFSSDKTDAGSYAHPGGQVATLKLAPRKVVSLTAKPKRPEVLRLMQASPDYASHLENWDENPKKAEQIALQSMLDQGPQKDVFIQVWYDFFRYDSQVWAQTMVALGYDGVLLQKNDGVEHFIAYDPNIIQVQSWEPYKQLESKPLRWVRRF